MPKNKKVLIVDDDPDILEALQLTFEAADYIARTTTKGEETYHQVDEFAPDIIILDVLLSGKDGRRICQKLKKDKATKHIPIIMISAHPEADKSTRVMGADDFLAKPFDLDDLLKKVEQHIRQKQTMID